MLALVGEATDEDTLKLARIERASVPATVLPDDAANGALTGKSVGEVERRGSGAFFVVQIDRPGALRGGTYQAAQSITHPGEDVTIEPDDAVLLVVRGSRLAVGALFSMPATRIRSGRGA